MRGPCPCWRVRGLPDGWPRHRVGRSSASGTGWIPASALPVWPLGLAATSQSLYFLMSKRENNHTFLRRLWKGLENNLPKCLPQHQG